MLELTHDSRSDERVSRRDFVVQASGEASLATPRCPLSMMQSTFDYWQLRAPAAVRRKCRANFSERSERAETLEAGWKFRGADAIRGLRERATRLLNPANSV